MASNELYDCVQNNDQARIAAILCSTHNQKDKDETMYFAAASNKTEILKIALNSGAGSTQNGILSETIERAAESGFYECVQLLTPMCEQKSIGRAVAGAAAYGHMDILTHLLPLSSLELNSEALKRAAHKGQRECLEILIPVSDPKHEDSEALYLAVASENIHCIKLLLPVSDPTAMNSQALQLAVQSEWREGMELLSPVSDVFAAFKQLRLSTAGYSDTIEKSEQYIHHYLNTLQKETLHTHIQNAGSFKPVVRKI